MATVAADTSAERFANRKQALNWLNAQGYKISQGKFYQDCAAGFPPMHTDGSLSRFQVMHYGQQLDLATRSAATQQDGDTSRRKEAAEAEIAEMKAERMRREEDKEWLHADQAWSVVAALVGSLRETLRHHLHSEAAALVHVAGGGQDRVHEVFEFLEEVVGKAFNEVAGKGVDFELGEG